MKRRLSFLCMLVFALQAGARTADCDNVGIRLNALVSADQQIRYESNLLDQNYTATAADKDRLQKRWQTTDAENLKQVKEILGACGWPKTKKDSHSAWLLAQHADNDLAFQRLSLIHI